MSLVKKNIKWKLSFQLTSLTIHDELFFKWNVLHSKENKKKEEEAHIHCHYESYILQFPFMLMLNIAKE